VAAPKLVVVVELDAFLLPGEATAKARGGRVPLDSQNGFLGDDLLVRLLALAFVV
jgi:hypothetical protein